MKLGLRIDVTDARAAREGVPRLLGLLQEAQAAATFFFNVGPAHALGVPWLPARDMGNECRTAIAQVREAGCEAGLLAFDAARWRAGAATADGTWTARSMTLGCERFAEIAGAPPASQAAAGWQMNRHAFRLTQRMGLSYGTHTRGRQPFIPVCDGEVVACPQLPVTLPTLAECLAAEGGNLADASARLLAASAAPAPAGHIYCASARFEGGRHARLFARALAGWREQGHEPVTLASYAESADVAHLPRHVVAYVVEDGAGRAEARQGKEFLA